MGDHIVALVLNMVSPTQLCWRHSLPLRLRYSEKLNTKSGIFTTKSRTCMEPTVKDQTNLWPFQRLVVHYSETCL